MQSNDYKLKLRKWACAFCKKSFRYFSPLARHILYHIGEKCFFCKFCDQSFAEKSHLVEHRSVRHPNQKSLTESGGLEKTFTCITCGRVFAARRYLRKHELTHKAKSEKNEKTTMFECQKCGELLRRTTLGTHVLKCQPEMFKKTKINNTENQLMELKNKPEATETESQGHEEIQFRVCCICDDKFENEAELIKHRRSHYDIVAENEMEEGDDGHDHGTKDGMEMKRRKMEEAQTQDKDVTSAAVTKKKKGHKKIKYRCLFCPAKFRTMSSLEIHFETEHKGNVELDYDEDEIDDLNPNDREESGPCKSKKRRLATDAADLRGHED